jgi:enoyl-CoA hydratase
MTTTISLSITDRVGTLTLTPATAGKPPTLNHAVLDQFDAVLAQLETAARSADLDLVFIRSAAPKYFCVGADVASLQTLDAESIILWVEHGHRVFNRLEDLPVPVVARVEGYALGGGLKLAMACDAIFASESAQLGQTEAKLGFVAGSGWLVAPAAPGRHRPRQSNVFHRRDHRGRGGRAHGTR